MKRPLVVITAGFVLGEVLALCLQEAVYRIFFWFAGSERPCIYSVPNRKQSYDFDVSTKQEKSESASD